MISRSELKRLQAHKGYPSISLLAPTHRTSPDNKRDPIVVKNLVSEGVERLHEEFNKREVADLLVNLTKLIDDVQWEHTLDGLALFASKDFIATYYLPFTVEPRFVVDETFATRDLVFAYNRAPMYKVLVLSEKPTRLFEGSADVLHEVTTKPFPMTHEGAGGATRLPGGQGINTSGVRDEKHREFFIGVDQALSEIQKADPTPIVLVGVDRYLAFFQEVSTNTDAIVAQVAGNHDSTNPSDLGKLVWPLFQAGFTSKRTKGLATLSNSVKMNKHASGIDQVWRAGYEKKIKTLLVEIGFKHPADLSPEKDQLLPYTGKGAQALDDAVDELIETVIADGGDVYFYDTDTLDQHQKIAAILRY